MVSRTNVQRISHTEINSGNFDFRLLALVPSVVLGFVEHCNESRTRQSCACARMSQTPDRSFGTQSIAGGPRAGFRLWTSQSGFCPLLNLSDRRRQYGRSAT